MASNGVNGNHVTNGSNGVNGTNGINGNALPALAHSADEFLKHDYDFIIVGGGTAGLVVAARLTENEDVSVGVLEAGKNKLDDPLVDSPVTFMQMYNNPEYDWMINTVPQVSLCMQLILRDSSADTRAEIQPGSSPSHPRGKCLGGSSGINYMMCMLTAKVWHIGECSPLSRCTGIAARLR